MENSYGSRHDQCHKFSYAAPSLIIKALRHESTLNAL
jgi:hypothetical protein